MFNLFHSKTITFPQKIQLYENKGIKFIKKMPVKANDEIVYLSSGIDKDSFVGLGETCCTLVTNKSGNILGSHHYKINNTKNKKLVGTYISTKDSHQNKGIGEIMRLASIIEMKENKLPQIDIVSINKALPFHIKYKFKPDIDTSFDIYSLLGYIAMTNKKFKDQATILLKKTANLAINDKKNEYISEANNFIENYIKSNSENWKSFHVEDDIPLTLKDVTLKENADFFNTLFKKRGIDYSI